MCPSISYFIIVFLVHRYPKVTNLQPENETKELGGQAALRSSGTGSLCLPDAASGRPKPALFLSAEVYSSCDRQWN